MVNEAPAVTFVDGQSARARSRPLNLAMPPLHSLPSGITVRSLPLTFATRMLSQSATSAPTATAALHASDDFCAAVPMPQATDRDTGVCSAPCACAGVASTVTARNASAAPATAARARIDEAHS